MELAIGSIHVQRDQLKEDEYEGELNLWKRITVNGTATTGREEYPFEVILGWRDHLMKITKSSEDGPSPDQIAQGLVYKMCEFIAEPPSSLFVDRSREEDDIAEWMVTNPPHASGLIHRLKEESPFEAPVAAPESPPLDQIVERLVDAVAYTTKSVEEWERQMGNRQKMPSRLRFETYAWEVHRDRLRNLTDDHELREQFGRFFHWAEVCRECVRTIQRNVSPREFKGERFKDSGAKSAARRFRGIIPRTTRLGHKLIDEYGTEEQRERGTRDLSF